MKVSNIPDIKQQVLAPPISMERPSTKVYSKTDSLTFKLKSTPEEEGSSTYELTVPFFSTGTPEEVLLFFRGVEQVFVGQNITEARDKFNMMERLLQGDALANWKQMLAHIEEEHRTTHISFTLCKTELKKHVFPPLALKKQKKASTQRAQGCKKNIL